MADERRNDPTAGNTHDETGHDSRNLDPRDTDHPTGSAQAAENAANDSPS